MKNLKKRDLVARLAQDTKLTHRDAERVLNTAFALIVFHVTQGRRVYWPGFGVWTVRTRKARFVRSPKTGRPLRVGARRAIAFRGSEKLRDL